MPIIRFLPLLTLAVAAGAAQATTLPSTSFAAGTEGWTAVDGARDLGFVATGGIGGAGDGFAMATDNFIGKAWMWSAPSSYFGDLSAAYGGTLSYWLQASRVTVGGQSLADVVLEGSGLRLAADAGANPGLTWTPYSVSLSAGSWHLGDLSGALASAAQLQAVLADVTGLYIRGDYSPLTRGAVTGLDAVAVTSLVPEPGTWALWLAGVLAIGAVVRRR